MQHKARIRTNFINDFQKKQYETSLKANQELLLTHYSAEYLRAQSQRLKEQVEKEKNR